MQFLHKPIFLKSTSGKKRRTKAEQSQITKVAHEEDASMQQPTESQSHCQEPDTGEDITLTIKYLPSHNLEESLDLQQGQKQTNKQKILQLHCQLQQSLHNYLWRAHPPQSHAHTCLHASSPFTPSPLPLKCSSWQLHM